MRIHGGLSIAFALALGCGSSEEGTTTQPAVAQGSEAGPCYPNGTCDGELTCASGLCVDTSETTAGGSGPGGAGGDAGASTDGGSGGSAPGTGGEGGSSAGGAPAAGGMGGSGGAPACLAVGDDCSNDFGGCCNGTTCTVDQSTQVSVCAANCTSGTDCNSGCCVELTNTPGAVCAPQSYCETPCLPAGTSCVGGGQCCLDSICVVDAVVTACAGICAAHDQCASGCCAPLDNAAVFVCSPVTFCL